MVELCARGRVARGTVAKGPRARGGMEEPCARPARGGMEELCARGRVVGASHEASVAQSAPETAVAN